MITRKQHAMHLRTWSCTRTYVSAYEAFSACDYYVMTINIVDAPMAFLKSFHIDACAWTVSLVNIVIKDSDHHALDFQYYLPSP